MLESDMRRAVTAALNRRAHSPLPSASAIDFPYTIRRNLRHYHPQLKTIVPERVYFFDRSSRTNRWNVILDIDQSGSMGESIFYSSIMACILASMSAVKTRVVAFDTAVMDLTDLCQDPVDLLFGFRWAAAPILPNPSPTASSLWKNRKKRCFSSFPTWRRAATAPACYGGLKK